MASKREREQWDRINKYSDEISRRVNQGKSYKDAVNEIRARERKRPNLESELRDAESQTRSRHRAEGARQAVTTRREREEQRRLNRQQAQNVVGAAAAVEVIAYESRVPTVLQSDYGVVEARFEDPRTPGLIRNVAVRLPLHVQIEGEVPEKDRKGIASRVAAAIADEWGIDGYEAISGLYSAVLAGFDQYGFKVHNVPDPRMSPVFGDE